MQITIGLWGIPVIITVIIWLWPWPDEAKGHDIGSAIVALMYAFLSAIITLLVWISYFITIYILK